MEFPAKIWAKKRIKKLPSVKLREEMKGYNTEWKNKARHELIKRGDWKPKRRKQKSIFDYRSW